MNNNIQKIGVISDWVYVYKNFISNNIINGLKYKITGMEGGVPIEREYCLFDEKENSNIIAIPRFCNYAINLLKNNLLVDERTIGEDININVTVPPRDQYQIDAINCILLNDNGVIKAKTAFGKTYVAINVIATLKKKALILLHKKDLAIQWKDDILKYTDLNENDIQIFTGNEKNFKKGKAITITTVQNLSEKIRMESQNVREIFKDENFGITFYDECHTNVGPYSNSLTSRFVFSKKIFGLSATPKRSDESNKAIQYIIGNIIYTDNRKMIPVYISFAPVNIEIPEKTIKYLSIFKNTYALRYAKFLQKNEEYVNYCSNIIYSLIKIDKKILVVAQYKDILQVIYDKVYSIIGDNRDNVDKIRMIHGTSTSKFKDVKDMNEEEIKDFNCIFTTTSFFSAGLSINWLNTIVYLTPPSAYSLSAIPQLIGRIVRDYKDKKYVNVIDFYNKLYLMDIKRKKYREEAYKRFNYHVLPDSQKMVLSTDDYVNNMIHMCELITNYNENKHNEEDLI